MTGSLILQVITINSRQYNIFEFQTLDGFRQLFRFVAVQGGRLSRGFH